MPTASRTWLVTTALMALGLSVAVAQGTREVRKTLPLGKNGQVVVDTYKGSIRVEPWDRDEIDVVAKIEPEGTGRDAREAAEDTEIEISGSDRTVRIKTDYDNVRESHSWFFGFFGSGSTQLPFVHYVIKMPPSAEVRIKDYKSESRISGMKASVRINTYKGTVDILDHRGGVDLETYKGEAEIEFSSLGGELSVDTYKGDIRILLPSKQGFNLDADIGRHGTLDSDFSLRDLRSRRHDGDEKYRGELNGGGPRILIKTYKGEIRLREGKGKKS